MAYTNDIKSVWAVLKHGYNSVYYRWSGKYVAGYINEFTFWLNKGGVWHDTIERIDDLYRQAIGKWLTCKELTQ